MKLIGMSAYDYQLSFIVSIFYLRAIDQLSLQLLNRILRAVCKWERETDIDNRTIAYSYC
jgi:hypothetical protein